MIDNIMTAEQQKAVGRLREALEDYKEDICGDSFWEELLWDTLLQFQGHPFYTAKNLEFFYYIKGNEMFVTRKDKSITRASVMMAFHKVLKLDRVVQGPKKLGTFGASYLYPVFIHISVIKSRGLM